MAVREIESRVAMLEAEMARVRAELQKSVSSRSDWLDDIFGAFDNDPIYKEAMKPGEAYRKSLRPRPSRASGKDSKKSIKRPKR